MGKITLLIVFVLSFFIFSSCDSSNGCKTSADCGESSVCYNEKCVDVNISTATLSFENIKNGDTIDFSKDVSATSDGIQLDISVAYSADSSYMENTGVVLSVVSDNKTSTYAGVFLNKTVSFAGITLPEGSVKLKAYSVINNELSTDEITINVTAVTSKLQIKYLKNETAILLDGASFTEADDEVADNNYFDLSIVVDAPDLNDGSEITLAFDNQLSSSISAVIYQGRATFNNPISFPFSDSVMVTATSGDYSSSAIFTLELTTKCSISVQGMPDYALTKGLGAALDEDTNKEGLQLTLTFSSTCALGSALKLFVNTDTDGTPVYEGTYSVESTSVQVTIPESVKNGLEVTSSIITAFITEEGGKTGVVSTSAIVDITPPACTVVFPANDTITNANDTDSATAGIQTSLKYSCVDNISSTVSASYVVLGNTTDIFNIPADNEEQSIDLEFTENAENISFTMTFVDDVANGYAYVKTFSVSLANPLLNIITICGKSINGDTVSINNDDDTDSETEGIQCGVELSASDIDASTENVSLFINDALFGTAAFDSESKAVFSTTFNTGTYTLKGVMTDFGNTIESSVVTVASDTTVTDAPVVTVASPTNNLRPVWNWNSVSGAVKYRTGFDNSTWVETTGTSYIPIIDLNPANSPFTLYVQAANSAGNWSSSGSATVVIDNVAPLISLSYPSSTFFAVNTVNMSDELASAGVMKKIEFTTDSENGTSASITRGGSVVATAVVSSGKITFNNVSLSAGSNNFSAVVTDSAGNDSSALDFIIYYDVTLPDITIMSLDPALSGTTVSTDMNSAKPGFQSQFNITLANETAGSKIWYKVGSASYSTTPSTLSVDGGSVVIEATFIPGDNILTVKAQDVAGNIKESSFTYNASIPGGERVEITSPVEDVYQTGNSFTFTVKVTDTSTPANPVQTDVYIMLDDNDSAPVATAHTDTSGEATMNFILSSEGTHTVNAFTANGVSTAIRIKYDATAPVVTPIYPATASFNINFSNYTTYIAAGTSNLTLITVEADDAEENSQAVLKSGVSTVATGIVGTDRRVSFANVPLTEDALNSFTVEITDLAGNTSLPLNLSYRYDKTKPSISWVSPAPNGDGDIIVSKSHDTSASASIYSINIVVNVSGAEAGSTINVSGALAYANPVSVTSKTANNYTLNVQLQDGARVDNNLTISITDLAGNSFELPVTIIVDTTTPTLKWNNIVEVSNNYKFIANVYNIESGVTVELLEKDSGSTVFGSVLTVGSLGSFEAVEITPASQIPDKCGAYNFYMRLYDSNDSKYIYTTTSDDITIDYKAQIVDFNDPVIDSVTITSDGNSDGKIGLNDDESSTSAGLQIAMEFDVTGADEKILTLYDGETVVAAGTVASGKCYFDNMEHNGVTNNYITVSDGTKNWTATVTDCNENISETFNIPQFTVDSIAPVVTVTAPDKTALIVSDGTGVNASNQLEGITLTVSFGENLTGQTLTVSDTVTDFSGNPVRVDTFSSITVSANPQTISLPALDYNRHSFTVTVPDSFGNNGTALRTYKVDPIAPSVTVLAPADGLEINESNDAATSVPGIQFTATISYSVEPIQTTGAELNIYAIPVDAVGNPASDGRTETTLLTLNSLNADASNVVLPSASYFSLSSGYWQIKAGITDDNGNSSESGVNTINVTSSQPSITIKTKNGENISNNKWLKASEGSVSGSTFITDVNVTTTDSIEGTVVELWINGVKESSDVQINSSGEALFTNVTLNLSETANTIKAVVKAGEDYEYEYTGVKVDETVPVLSLTQPSIVYTGSGKNELAYAYDDDSTPGDMILNFKTTSGSENYIKFGVTNAVNGTVTVSGTGVAGTTSATVSEDTGNYYAAFTGLTLSDSVSDGQTDTDLVFTITEKHDGQTTNTSTFELTLHFDLENPLAPSFAATPVVVDSKTAALKLSWTDVEGNSSSYGSLNTAVEKYLLRYKTGDCPATVDDSFISTGTTPIMTYASVTVGTLDSDEGSVSGVNNGDSRDVTFSVNRLKVLKMNLDPHSGSFELGDTVTGNTSGATGIISAVATQNTQQVLYLKSLTGTFVLESITTSASAIGTVISKTLSDSDVHINGTKYCVAMQSVDGIYAEDGTILKENRSDTVTSTSVGAVEVKISQLTNVMGATVFANAGDIDGDGSDDMVFGSVNVNSEHGYLAVVSSNRSLLLEKVGTALSEGYGQSVTAGDFNGDSKRDIAYLDYYGGVHIHYGTGTALESSETTFTVANGCRINVTNAESFASAGNTLTINSIASTVLSVSGDIIYLNNASCNFSAEDEVTNNTTSGTATVNYGTSWFEANSGWYDSYGFIAAADVNGDGIDDLAVTVPEQMINGKSNAGAMFVYYGNSAKTYDGKYSDISVFGNNADDAFGSRVINAGYIKDGDVSGTRYESLLVGTNGANIYSKLLYGNDYSSGSYGSDLDMLTFNEGGTLLPSRTSKSDLNGDSYDDLILSDRENLYIYYGSSSGIGTGTLAEGVRILRSAIALVNYSMPTQFAISVSSGYDLNTSGTSQDIYTVGNSGNIYLYEGEYITETPAVDRRNHPKVIYQGVNAFKVVMINNGFVYCKNDYKCYIATY